MKNQSYAWGKTKNYCIIGLQKKCSGLDCNKKINLRWSCESARVIASWFDRSMKDHVKTQLITCYNSHHYCKRLLLKLFKWRCLLLLNTALDTLAAPRPHGSAIQVHESWPAITSYTARPTGNSCARNLPCWTIGHPYVSRLARHMQRISCNSSWLSS